jgi:hypothetical protein
MRKLGRNEPCWCSSGKKYKRCHWGKPGDQAPLPSEVKKIFDGTGSGTGCLFPIGVGLECGSRPIRSHTVSNAAALALISEDGVVLTPKLDLFRPRSSTGSVPIIPLGASRASVLPLFCGDHDALAFRSVDQSLATVDPQSAFLLGYRAICAELYRKLRSVRILNKRLNLGIRTGELNEFQQSLMMDFIRGSELARRDLQHRKALWDADLIAGHWGAIDYLEVSFDQDVPLAASGIFSPEYDCSGERIQDWGDETAIVEGIAITLLPGRVSGRLILTVRADERAAKRYLDTLEQGLHSDVASKVCSLCFAFCENIFLRPSWWTALPEADRRHLLRRFDIGSIPEVPVLPRDYLLELAVHQDWGQCRLRRAGK